MAINTAVLRNGWVCIPYEGHDAALVEIGFGQPVHWEPAFLDYLDGQRVAKIRPVAGLAGFVSLRVNGVEVRSDRYMP